MKYDCSYFEGHIPCKPNKIFDVQCDNCSHYDKDTAAIINLNTNESLLNEIYKLSNFTKKETVKELPNISVKATRILFIKLGHVKGSQMVDMKLSNEKLIERGTKMVKASTGLNDIEAKELLLKHKSVREAIINYETPR